jgi:hypothetical protein
MVEQHHSSYKELLAKPFLLELPYLFQVHMVPKHENASKHATWGQALT